MSTQIQGEEIEIPTPSGGVSMSQCRKSMREVMYTGLTIFREYYLLHFAFSNMWWTADPWILFHCLTSRIAHGFQGLSLALWIQKWEMIKRWSFLSFLLHTVLNIFAHGHCIGIRQNWVWISALSFWTQVFFFCKIAWNSYLRVVMVIKWEFM